MAEQQKTANTNTKLQSILLAAAFILFVIFLLWGIFSGVTYGKDKATYKNIEAINDALTYYHSDQDRYPSAAQFSNQILVPLYISAIPKPENAAGSCASYPEFKYSQTIATDFKIEFCLNQGYAGLSKGLHVLTAKSIN